MLNRVSDSAETSQSSRHMEPMHITIATPQYRRRAKETHSTIAPPTTSISSLGMPLQGAMMQFRLIGPPHRRLPCPDRL